MKIEKILYKFKNDFTAIMKCEICGHHQKLSTGYDDHNYHENVIPKMKCDSCGKTREDKDFKNNYTFKFDIKGSCEVNVEANSLEEAVERLKNDEGVDYELCEWDAIFPDTDEEIKKCKTHEVEAL